MVHNASQDQIVAGLTIGKYVEEQVKAVVMMLLALEVILFVINVQTMP
jgi:hypothetical protein